MVGSLQAWVGSISATVFAEYIKPSVDYGTYIFVTKLEVATGVPVPEDMSDGLSMAVMIAVIFPIIHLLRKKGVLDVQSDPSNSAGA